VTRFLAREKMLQVMDGSFITVLCAEAGGPLDAARLEALRALVAEHAGREISATGDALVVAFASASSAVRCAVDLQGRGGVELRVGLDAGEAGGGRPTMVARRLCEHADLGAIVASDVVCQVARVRDARPLGALRLRGLEERVVAAQLADGDAAEPEPEADPADVSRPIRVVIADDQRLLRTGFRVILDAEPDITVVGEAGDGRTAVDVVRRVKPDVVLMDIRMPEIDGLEAARVILDDSDSKTAVLMLTTFDLDEYIYEALRIGASGFLLKDTPADRLLDAVRVVADGEALLAPSITRRMIERFGRAPRAASAEAVPDRLADLTSRELDVLRLMARGLSNAEIADQLVLGANTIKTHVAHVLSKLGLRDRVQAVVVAYETGLVSPSSE
jgi:DNA-binding NarL/FixJ family response regulator